MSGGIRKYQLQKPIVDQGFVPAQSHMVALGLYTSLYPIQLYIGGIQEPTKYYPLNRVYLVIESEKTIDWF